MFPLVPFPESFQRLLGFTSVTDMNGLVYVFAALFGFLGVIYIVLGALGVEGKTESSKKFQIGYVRNGFAMIGFAILALLFGFYIIAMAMIYAAGILIYGFYKGAQILLTTRR